MIQVILRNLALSLGKLLLLCVGIFILLRSTSSTYDANLSFVEFFRAIFSGRMVQSPAAGNLPPLMPAFVYTSSTVGLALVLSYGIGAPAGIFLGRYRQAWCQVLGNLGIGVAMAIPAFWTGYVILFYSISQFGIFIGGEEKSSIGDYTLRTFIGKSLLLAVPLSLSGIALVARQVSLTLGRSVPEDVVQTWRALGVTQRSMFDTVLQTVVWKPLLRAFPVLLSLFLSAIIVIEYAFFVPGFGYAVYKSAEQTDLQSLAVLSLWITMAVLMANLLVDTLLEIIDARQPAAPDSD